ncbi:uncharacterized protein LOC113918519 [Zalophus californianus]|uniref:Uncharacterized protein LOC113918519 n=1 Tax=Zalophus californianus TaxID=9704 RepID=A0A6J2CL42_ZALCA|nr:uncharacterized protein LOC113918519 [Zalophus californianus]
MPRASKEARVVTTGDEISLNYHSVGAGECSLSRSRCRAPAPALPWWPWLRPPRAQAPAEGAGGESAPSRRSPGERRNSQGGGEPEKKTVQNATCTVRGLDPMSKPGWHTKNYFCESVSYTVPSR